MKKILLSHGSGGKTSHDLLEFIYKILGEVVINHGEDSGIEELQTKKIAITTDSYVIDPIFFPGGNIGKLAICGTLNDLAMVGAKPVYITLALIIEENFSFNELKKILISIKDQAKTANVKIIAGDTKIVSKGKMDKIFINTAGYGVIEHNQKITSKNAQQGDAVIVSGDIGDHGTTIMALRNEFQSALKSDCVSVAPIIEHLLANEIIIHSLRDPTRGGLASILNEIANSSSVIIELNDEDIPIKDSVNGICDALGIDPLYMACEGRAVLICPDKFTQKVLALLSKFPQGKNARKVGQVISKSNEPKLLLKTFIGSKRILPLLTREQTPRIC